MIAGYLRTSSTQQNIEKTSRSEKLFRYSPFVLSPQKSKTELHSVSNVEQHPHRPTPFDYPSHSRHKDPKSKIATAARPSTLPLVKTLLLTTLLLLPLTSRAEEIWNLETLSTPPAFRWDDETASIRSFLYEGATIDGKATGVFAFYADPSTVGLDENTEKPYPAVVLIHGGGGTAFAEWVNLWARRGYAAIAMDLSGHRPPSPSFDPKTGVLLPGSHAHKKQDRTKLERGGLGHTHSEKFASIATATTDDD